LIVALDATALMLLMRPDARAPTDPETGEQVEGAADRIAHLVEMLEKARAEIVIPTPALSEILVRAGDAGPEILDALQRQAVFSIKPFGVKAAVEVAERTRKAIQAGDRRGGTDETWAKVKFDRQIVAIALVERATVIYSDDKGVKSFGEEAGLRVVRTTDLPLPEQDPQGDLFGSGSGSNDPAANDKTPDEHEDDPD
jgi:predicted nucleic acid-binding protein